MCTEFPVYCSVSGMIRVWKIDLQLIIKIKRFLFRSLLVYFSVLLLLLLLFSLAAVLCDRNKYRCKELSCRFLNSSRIAYAILKCSHLECLRNAENHCHSRERASEWKWKRAGCSIFFRGVKKRYWNQPEWRQHTERDPSIFASTHIICVVVFIYILCLYVVAATAATAAVLCRLSLDWR